MRWGSRLTNVVIGYRACLPTQRNRCQNSQSLQVSLLCPIEGILGVCSYNSFQFQPHMTLLDDRLLSKRNIFKTRKRCRPWGKLEFKQDPAGFGWKRPVACWYSQQVRRVRSSSILLRFLRMEIESRYIELGSLDEVRFV